MTSFFPSIHSIDHTKYKSRTAQEAHHLRANDSKVELPSIEKLGLGVGATKATTDAEIHRGAAIPTLPVPIPEYDVFIAGSGPVGATYARQLVEKGYSVCLVDVGELESVPRGSHKKNTVQFQKNIDLFVGIINGSLDAVSVPVNTTAVNNLNPKVWRADKPFVRNGANPEQDAFRNLPAQKVTRCVGGMATHWTCATPRFHPIERPILDINPVTNNAEWERLYGLAEGLIGTSPTQFDHSIRHNLVLRTLQNSGDGRTYQAIPLACHRVSETFVDWHSAHTVFDFEFAPNDKYPNGLFHLFPATLCQAVVHTEVAPGEYEITSARVFNLNDQAGYEVRAKVFILAAGAVQTPQILVNSGLADFGKEQTSRSLIPNLGHYITEQTMSFCQIILYKELVDSVRADIHTSGTPGVDWRVWYDPSPNNKNPNWWNDKVVAHMLAHPEDPIPIPFSDPEPQVTTLFNDKYHYHTQIHRDAFSYGAVAASIDSRLVVDLRFFGRTEPIRSNKIYYSDKYTDSYGMPKPTFDYDTPAGVTTTEASSMITDMCNVAAEIGGYLPGSEPQFMEPGLALHLGGTHRSGPDPETSVTDVHSKVHKFKNLFLGGVGNIPTAFGSNPTLTAMCYAIKSTEYIERNFTPKPRKP